MKVALCFSGGIRNLKDNFPSIKKCFIDTLNPDIFIHGWYFKIDELQNTHKMYHGHETDADDVFNLLKPTKIKLEIYDKYKENELAHKYGVFDVQKKFSDNPRILELFPNTVGMFYSIYQSNKLKMEYEDENNFTYDYVIRLRPDFEFYTPITNSILSLVQPKTILFPLDNYGYSAMMCDKFAIGTSKDMDTYSKLIVGMPAYIERFPKIFWDGPSILKVYLEKKHINIKWIYIVYEYHIRRKSQKLAPDKFKTIKYDEDTKLILEPTKYNFKK